MGRSRPNFSPKLEPIHRTTFSLSGNPIKLDVFRCVPSFDFQYYKMYKMVYSIDSTHLNCGHVYCADF